ncbi:hypothetical protein [Serratia sp. PL7]|uniref:hypothetical protein n=1 Tax=Serratia sp. PL7 TaxID=2952201 RepID=UPI001A0A7851|nr:hypothetical protein [Serratia sp. PL7]MBE0149639.1 hypothetical protein [Serratia fonticola]
MVQVVVNTKEELERAKKNKAEYIIVEGELANKLQKGKKVAKASGVSLAVLTAAFVATPFTGDISMFAATPIAVMSGFEIAAIIAAASIGLTLLIAIFKDYEEIEAGKGTLKLKRRQKD